MRSRVFPALLLLAFLAAPAIAQDPAPAKHVVLVSIDGLRPDFYRDRDWPAPNLQRLARDGVAAAAVRSVYPSVTYPSHTTMITGALPARHGVYYNSPFEPGGQTGRWYWEYDSIRVPTLFTAVRAAGGTTAAVNWPVSVGAPVDFLVPEVWSLQEGFGSVRPIREATRPAGLFEELEREATGALSDADVSDDWFGREPRIAMMAAHLIETRKPTFTAIHLIAADHFQHDDGRDSPRVRRAVAAVDTALGMILDAVERAGIAEQTAVIIDGDHGFLNVHTALAPNVWLAQTGLMEAAPDRGDWRATFHGASASAFLHLRDPADEEAVERVREILAAQPAAVRRLFSVFDREQLDRMGVDPAAALAIAPAPGISISVAATGAALRPASGGNHGFDPRLPELHTGFIASGAGVGQGVKVARMGLVDVAPVVAALLGLDFDAPDGVLLPGILAPRR